MVRKKRSGASLSNKVLAAILIMVIIVSLASLFFSLQSSPDSTQKVPLRKATGEVSITIIKPDEAPSPGTSLPAGGEPES